MNKQTDVLPLEDISLSPIQFDSNITEHKSCNSLLKTQSLSNSNVFKSDLKFKSFNTSNSHCINLTIQNKKFKVISIGFLTICLLLLTIFVINYGLNSTDSNLIPDQHTLNIESKSESIRQENSKINLDYGIFDEPTETEYENIIKYLNKVFKNIYVHDLKRILNKSMDRTNILSPSLENLSDHKLIEDTSISWSEKLRYNLIWTVTLSVPNKLQRTEYFQNLHQENNQSINIERNGHVVLFCGSCEPEPEIHEYLIENLNNPTNMKLLRKLPYYKRPFTDFEYGAIIDFLSLHTKRLDVVLQHAYNASFFLSNPSESWKYSGLFDETDQINNYDNYNSESKCTENSRTDYGRPNCLIPLYEPPLVTSVAPGRRLIWLRLHRELIPMMQYPVDMQFRIDHTSLDPNKWQLKQIWFQNQFFNSVDELLEKYFSKQIKIIPLYYDPTLYEKQFYPGPNQFKKNEKANLKNTFTSSFDENKPPEFKSTSCNHHTNRIEVNKRHVKYENWDFHVTIRRDTGLRLYGVYFSNLSWIAEAGLDETVTAYWGQSPFIQYMTSLESLYGIGTMTSELSPGIDCPKNSIFLPIYLLTNGEYGTKQVKNAICLFESDSDSISGPTRRHFEFGLTDSGLTKNYPESSHTNFAFGLKNRALIVRSVFSIFNYDYIFDVILYSTGTIEFSVIPTGFIFVDTFQTYNYKNLNQFNLLKQSFGFISHNFPIYLTMHHHLFHFKIDVDLIKEKNFFKIVHIKGPKNSQTKNNNTDHEMLSQYPGMINDALLPGLWMVIDKPQNEMNARFEPTYDYPKQFLVCFDHENNDENYLNSDSNSNNNSPCLMFMNKGAVKTLFSAKHTKSFAWSRHHLYVTKLRDNETYASSIFNGVDLDSPVVDFTKFSSNNESIVNEELSSSFRFLQKECYSECFKHNTEVNAQSCPQLIIYFLHQMYEMKIDKTHQDLFLKLLYNEDLVLWVTIGNYHLPRQEDLPNTVTSGGRLSFHFSPHNIFLYSPDAFHCDRFYTRNLSEWIKGPKVEEDCKMEPVSLIKPIF